MKRREFLTSGLGFALGACFPLPSIVKAGVAPIPGQRGYLVVADAADSGKPNEDRANRTNPDQPGFLSTWDIATKRLRRFPLPIFPHVFAQHPAHSDLVIGAAKWTPSAVVVNLRDGKILKLLKAPPSFRYFGHCGFSVDGKTVYISAHSNEENRGGLCVYDTKNWELKLVLDGGCRQPHEFIFTPNGNILLVGGGASSHPGVPDSAANHILTELCPASKTVLRTYDIPQSSHLQYLDADHVTLSGGSPTTPPTLAVLNLKTSKVKNSRNSKDYPNGERLSEALSIVKLSDHEIAASLIDAGELWLWNTKTSKMRVIDVGRRPRGLVHMGGNLYINQNKMVVRYSLSSDTFERCDRTNLGAYIGVGSHMRLMWF